MQLATVLAQALSILAFGWYGTLTLVSDDMVTEFERYRLGRLRVFTATLQVMGSLAMLAGYFVPLLLLLAAAGFTVMMFFAVLVRIRIRDPVFEMIPAFVLMCLNLFLVIRSLR